MLRTVVLLSPGCIPWLQPAVDKAISLTEVQTAISGQYVDGPWQYLRVEGTSHWLTLDRPTHLAQVLVDYLCRAIIRLL